MDPDDVNKLMEDLFADEKRRLRPELGVVITTLDDLFSNSTMRQFEFAPKERGPERWTWEDRLGKILSVQRACRPGTEDDGYPTFTIMQPVVPVLGGYITTTTFVLGADPDGITSALTSVWVNHWGAYNGLTTVSKAMVSGGGAAAGADAAEQIRAIGGSVDSANAGFDMAGAMSAIDDIVGKKPTGNN